MRTVVTGTVVLVLVALGGAAVVLLRDQPETDTRPGTCQIVAHRGNTDVPDRIATENGMKAFRRATTLGVDWVETDVASTSDDVPMLMHDDTVDATTNGTGLLRSMTVAQADRLRLDDGSPIPHLTELLRLAQQEDVRVLLELHWPGGPLWWSRVAEAVKTYGEDRVVLQSISRSTLDRASTYLPGVPRTLVHWQEIPVATAREYGGIVIDKSVLSDSYLSRLDDVAVYPYLITDRAEWDRFAGHVEALLTDDPATLQEWRRTTEACR